MIAGRAQRLMAVMMVSFALLAGTGCIPDGLAFRQDHRLSISAPGDRSEVAVPFDVTWSLDNQGADERHFAVLVDRFPPLPGQSIEALLPDELREPARCDAACRTAALETRNIFVTDGTTITISRLAVRHGVSDEQQRRHEISIIILDREMRRIGETVVWVEVDAVKVTR